MEFTVSQNALSEALAIVSKGVASASTLPILSGVLITAGDGVLEFQTSNYTISIRHRIAAHVEKDGSLVVPCKTLSNITKTLPDAPVRFQLVERQVNITCEKSTFRLNTLDAADFPEFPTYALESAVELPSRTLTDMVARVWRVTSTDKARPILGGVHMTVENNTIRLVATDSFRLAVCDTQVETSSLEGSFELNVPADAFNDALTIMSEQQTILVGATDTQVVFEAGDTTYVSRRIEGVYPNYNQLIPDSCTTSVKIDVEAITAALKRVSAIASTNPAVKFAIDVERGSLALSAISSDQDLAQEIIDVEAEGESGVIAFNYHYIFGCLNVLAKEQEISLELKNYTQAGVFKSYGKINYLYLVMPVRI
ncbi:DNA polymerase III, beta subunit [Coriobacterium glomerans PW2]|uniref:Beta sliding clamp n=1 Tax=Coriobacterium glomerans (strain ATCC 49209 / DSM 20642 / JCM 10262 / PW2) TaxID=700015 RepID=F2N6T5_CORGP|nr:DNA polymerase III subunit beta [Coriobacterium glomerans]AEB06134.1 DNA polymerase III, beta subunit [Coriobacterium glomerans PW2]